MGMLKPKKPRPVAYCWLYYREMSSRQVQKNGCRDPDKQNENPDGVCKWLQAYGDTEGDRYKDQVLMKS